MFLTILSYAMIIVFMFVIMKKKMSPFTSLVIIPLLFTLVAMVAGVSEKAISVILSLRESPPQPTQGSCCCLRFCTFPLCWMRDCLIQSRKNDLFC